MDKKDLLQLEKLAALSPKEIELKEPGLYAKLSDSASISLKTNVEARFKNASAEIRQSIAAIDFSAAKLGSKDVRAVLSVNLLEKVTDGNKPELETMVSALPQLGTLDDIIQPDLPLAINPAFQSDLAKAKVYRMGDMLGFSQATTDKALVKELDLNTINADKLEELVKGKIINEQQAGQLGLATNLYTLFDGNFELTEQVLKAGTISNLEQLVNFNPDTWVDYIKNSRAALAEGMTAEAYAETLGGKVEALFPEATLGKLVAGRDPLFDSFMEKNAGINFLTLDYKHDSADLKLLNLDGFKAKERTQVMQLVKAYQRVYSFTQDIKHTESLIAAGFHSSFHIGSLTLAEFIRTSKLDGVLAARIFENAQMSIIRSTGLMGSILDILTGSFNWTAVGNAQPSIKDYLKDIPGYQDLFGSLAFCDCADCQSIFSPAAYFVDLMQFIEKQVLSEHFAGSKASHVLNLKVRRPDLWTLPLSCENTNALVPYLDIINEILASYIASKKGYTGNLNDQAALDAFVYKQEIALEVAGNWKDKVHSFKQPFHLPLTAVSTYLGHFEKTREDVTLLLRQTPEEVAKARFGLSDKKYTLISTEDQSAAFIRQVYGISFTPASGIIDPLDAQLLLRPMGLSRKELEQILTSRFVTNNGASGIVIQAEKTDANSIQNDLERVRNLSYEALDRAHRFVRFWKKTNWTIGELDQLLGYLIDTGITAGLNAAAITALGQLSRLQDKLQLSVPEAIYFLHAYPLPDDPFSLPGLMYALQLPEADVLLLQQRLAAPLAALVAGEAKLSLLYRHARLATQLKRPVDDLFRLIGHLPALTNGYVENADQAEQLLAFHAWLVTAPYSLDQLQGPLDAAATLALVKAGNILPADEFAAQLTLFEVADPDDIGASSIQLLHAYLSFIRINDDGSHNKDQLTTLLGSYVAASQYQAADQDLLASVLQTTPELLAGIHAVLPAAGNAIQSLQTYKAFVALCTHVGVGADVLGRIAGNGYDDLAMAEQALLAAFRIKYPTADERMEKLEPYQDRLRGKKRSSLTTYLTHSGFEQFKREDDLFHYFLIDTELEGCARTSRLVAATMSLQIYVQRILLNLEQDSLPAGTTGRVNLSIDPDNPGNKAYTPIPADEWEWRKHYRAWEANRKIFLYPENYIEPDLRDDKTPLFEELENELLQREINGETVLDAYAKYMRGFDEVAHLRIAGSYHEKDSETETDVLHLFGVTADEPPLYYYRKVENSYYAEKNDNRGMVWGPWQKINVQIPVRTVAPITYNGRLYVFWVKVTTLANTVFDSNRSVFTGYSHKFAIEFSTLKLDGSWTPPQKLKLKDCHPFSGNGVLYDPLADDVELGTLQSQLSNILRGFPFFNWSSSWDAIRNSINALKTPRYDTVAHYEAVDEYSLQGFLWDQVYPNVDENNRLNLTGAAYQLRGALDFYNLSLQNSGWQLTNVAAGFDDPVEETLTLVPEPAGKIIMRSGNNLYRAQSPTLQRFDNYAYGSLLVNASASHPLLSKHWNVFTLNASFNNVQQEQLAVLRAGSNVQVINGAYGDAIIDVQGDLLFLQGTPIDGDGFILKRLGTTLSETLTRTLFSSGVDTTLSIETQQALKEAPAPISISAGRIANLVKADQLDFRGAYGNYYREIFFHIPYLLANHLNSQGRYAEAQKWYHYIFNPTAAGDSSNRSWQYLEFRELDVQNLRDQLNDKQAIEVYKKDPFNPHAIARLRLSAYQKNIVMKYIDNLLDWGDQLFTQDTMESVNEATLLYIIAREILGDRPAEIGDCAEGNAEDKTYASIQPKLNQASEFFAELESYTVVSTPGRQKQKNKFNSFDNQYIAGKTKKTGQRQKPALSPAQLAKLTGQDSPEVTVKAADNTVTGLFAKGTNRAFEWKKESIYVRGKNRLPSFGWSLLRHVSPVFCVPGNQDLLAYYDRVDDRLFKIRNCMNILGERRQLALFAPEIDPRLLVRARAAGLSLEDIEASTGGSLPAYRFTFLLERARAFTSVVQSFGSALQSAIDRKEGEELALLRMTQQQNLLEMSSKSRKLEIDSAQKGVDALTEQISSLTYQIAYHEALISQNLNGWETLQSASRHTATISKGVGSIFFSASGILNLLPQLGSPFAMKYGGAELGGSAEKWAQFSTTLAGIADGIAASAGLEAGFERRSEGWKHQKKLLGYQLTQTEKNLIAAEIKRDILIEAEKIHQKGIEHSKEVMEFYGQKFSSLGLYTYLASTMQRLFKDAYNNALTIARMAEQAYRYERDGTAMFIDGSYFESSRAGLQAGERLLMALQTMERTYLETNYRKNDIDQAFSLTQIDPAALMLLKQTGTCSFHIPELFFDLFYPGQYKRKIQSVRLTIPSVTGPYTNVSATLSLTASQLRTEAKLGASFLTPVPQSRATTIATSTAQNDAGVFSVNFNDGRYLPFEGLGAISSWTLSLPKNFRQFDYSSINDVIIHISYTAEYDGLYREQVEAENQATEGTLLNLLKNNALSRSFSLRQEFSNDFHRLTGQDVNHPVSIRIQNKHFPLFLNGRALAVSKAKLILLTGPSQTVAGLDIRWNGVSQTGFSKDPAFGNLYSKDLGNLFSTGILKDHVVEIAAGGDLALPAPATGPASAIDTEKLADILLYVEYKLG